MHLTPRELDKLVLHQAGFLAQKRLARGVRLNYPEAIALISTVLLELIRDGRRVAELMDVGRRLLGRRQVLPGIPEMISEIQIEGTFPDGSKLVTVHHPIAAADGDLALALHGSFLPVPSLALFEGGGQAVGAEVPGEIAAVTGEVVLNAGREAIRLTVTNLADRPVQVGSHYHFAEVNPYLRFDRGQAYGRRLDVPAGMAVRFEPGETRTVELVPIAGDRVIAGGNGLASGPVTEEGRARAVAAALQRGFAHAEES